MTALGVATVLVHGARVGKLDLPEIERLAAEYDCDPRELVIEILNARKNLR